MRKITTKSQRKTLAVNGLGLQKSVDSFLRSLSSDLSKMLDGNHTFVFGNRSTVCQPIDVVRWLSEIHPGSSEGLHIRNIILSCLSDSEAAQGGSAVVCAASLSSNLGNRMLSGGVTHEELEKDLRVLSSFSRRCSSENIKNLLSQLDNDSRSLKLAISAIDSCSSNSIIQVSSSGKSTQILKTLSYKFSIQSPETFCSSSSNTSYIIRSPRVLSVDGFIESMSEIDGMVQESFASKTPLIIFARGFSDDVQNTLGVNCSHGHLKVVPVVVPYDYIGANLINDITVVCGADMVSTMKGEIISSRKWSDLLCIDSIDIDFSTGFCKIENEFTKNSVKIHRRNLRKKRQECTSPQELEIIDTRISSILGEGSCINLGEDLGDLKGIYRDRIGTHIRSYKSASKFGTVDLERDFTSLKTQFVRNSIKKLLETSKSYTSSSLIIGIRNSYSCINQINKIGGVIFCEK